MATASKRILICFFLFSLIKGYADTASIRSPILKIKEIPASGYVIRKGWLYDLSDKKENSSSKLNDVQWNTVDAELRSKEIERINFKGFIWFRIHIEFDSSLATDPIVITIDHQGASEIYFNDELKEKFGIVGPSGEKRCLSADQPIFINPVPGKDNILAIRYSNTEFEESYDDSGEITAGIKVRIENADQYYYSSNIRFESAAVFGWGLFVFFLAIGIVHLLLYLFYRERRSNLYFALFLFIFSYFFLYWWLMVSGTFSNPDRQRIASLAFIAIFPIFFFGMLTVLHSLFYDKFPKHLKYFALAALSPVVAFFIDTEKALILIFMMCIATTIEILRVVIIAIRNKKRGAPIISFGFIVFAVFVIACVIMAFKNGGDVKLNNETTDGMILVILLCLAIISIPLSMSVFLAWDFAGTNKTLSKKLIEVEELSVRTLEQEKEKQQILSKQNEMLEEQVEQRTREINDQKKVIEEKNKDITDSINYAQRIQRSILPTDQEIRDIFKESFVLFKPRDIVSGDFYQFKKRDDLRYAILADCTGHGVPGALMSMVGSNLLKQIILERGVKEPNKILIELHKEVRSTLRQASGATSHDGMDAAILLQQGKKIYIASANRPVYIVKKGEITELKPDKRSIGGSSVGDDVTFVLNEFEVETGMMVYLFSDGYADQFGGEQGKKFKVKNLSELLVSISGKPLEAQKEILNTTFDKWKNQLEQVDDVSLVGIRF